MRLVYKSILNILLLPFLVMAQDDISISTGIVGNGKYLGGKTADGQTTVPMLGIDANGNTVQNALSGKASIMAVAKTPIAQADASGLSLVGSGAGIKYHAYVPTLAATPAAANQYRPGLNVVPTNAANNAAFLGAATITPGEEFIITNNAGAAVRVKASGGATLNGATAGGYISVANLATVICRSASTTNQTCEQPVIPTPAGP